MYLTPLEILLYHSFRARGVQVEYCIYDRSVIANEVITRERATNIGRRQFWNEVVAQSEILLKGAGVNYELIGWREECEDIVDSIEGLDGVLNFVHDGIDFGKILKGVLYRYYKSLTYGADVEEVARMFLKTALSNYYNIIDLDSHANYDYILFSHGIYCTWEPIVNYCIKHNKDYVAYDRAKTKGHCNFNKNFPSPVWDMAAAWDRFSSYSLSKQESQMVDVYLRDRILQKNDVYAYNFGGLNDLQELMKKFNIAQDHKVITIFTNLIWDAANVSRDIAFKSPLDCINKTILQYQDRDDIHIIIRTHPAEKVLGTEERYGSLVRNMFTSLPKNVTIIEPEDDINSFSVIALSDIGIVHTSTVGLEMVIAGKPVILISDTHYRDKGFTFDATDSNNYFQQLDSLLEDGSLSQEYVDQARKYFYLMMFEYQHEMPIHYDRKNVFKGYSNESFYDLLQDKENTFNRIVNTICNMRAFSDFIFR